MWTSLVRCSGGLVLSSALVFSCSDGGSTSGAGRDARGAGAGGSRHSESASRGGEDRHAGDAGQTSSSVAADYAAAFPQDRVARLDITISASDWKRMLDDMTGKLGEFGAGGGDSFGEPGGLPDGGGLPSNLTDACKNQTEGATCEASFQGSSSSGTCTNRDGRLICLPEGGLGGPGGAPGDNDSVDPLAETPIYVECEVATEDRSWKYVGIRFKGDSSLSTPWLEGIYKLPLRLKFDKYEKQHPEIEKQRFYGFKNLSLSNGWGDPSLLREKLGNELFRRAGFAVSASAFYQVYIDHGDGLEYFGLYAGIELPSDSAFLKAHFGSAKGNLYKPDGPGATFATWDQPSFEKETNEDEADWSDVKAVFDALHADRTDAAGWRARLEAVFDVDTFLHWLALNTIIENWDAYGAAPHNSFLYAAPEDHGKLRWIPWDQSFAFCTDTGEFSDPTDEFVWDAALDQSGITDAWPLIRFLIDDAVYRAKYDADVAQAASAEYTPAIFEDLFRKSHELIAPYVVGDGGERKGYSFLGSNAAFNDSVTDLVAHVRRRQSDVATYLKNRK